MWVWKHTHIQQPPPPTAYVHTHIFLYTTFCDFSVSKRLEAVVLVSKRQSQWNIEGRTEKERPHGENTWATETRAKGDESELEQLFDKPFQSPNGREGLPEDCSHQLYLAQQASGVSCTTFCFFRSSTSFTFYLLAFFCSQGNHLFLLLNKSPPTFQNCRYTAKAVSMPNTVWARTEWDFELSKYIFFSGLIVMFTPKLKAKTSLYENTELTHMGKKTL